jgi:chitin disaccharide deacetylase
VTTARRHVIFNADDFGASDGVNRGIIDGHTRGVVTSTTFMVTGRAHADAVAMSRDHPSLAIGLHWDVWGEDEHDFDVADHPKVKDEFTRQLAQFHTLFGRLPTHIDSHKHAHLRPEVRDYFFELAEPVGVPIRGDGRVTYVSDFYAQWEWKVTDLRYVSVPFLIETLRTKTGAPWTELSCHPGYVTPDYEAVYLHERETELQSLVDSKVRTAVTDLELDLASYADYGSARDGRPDLAPAGVDAREPLPSSRA